MVSILIVESHELVRTGMRQLLEAEEEFRVVGECATGEHAIRMAKSAAPNVVVLDMNIPGLGGIETTRRLARMGPATKVLAVGPTGDGPYPSRVLEVGAGGFVTKDSSPEELCRAVRIVHSGAPYISAAVAQGMVLGKLDPRRTPMGALTARELTVMVLVSQGHDRKTISNQLCLSPKTVSTYRSRIMRKLGASSDVELTHLSYRHGLIESYVAS